MTNTNSSAAILKKIDLKYDAINQKTETQLEGFKHLTEPPATV